MRLVYLPSTAHDLIWLRTYYAKVFPEGAKKAREEIKRAERLLQDHPFAGERFDNDLRELLIPRTPFAMIYRVAGNRIEILEIQDVRCGGRNVTTPPT